MPDGLPELSCDDICAAPAELGSVAAHLLSSIAPSIMIFAVMAAAVILSLEFLVLQGPPITLSASFEAEESSQWSSTQETSVMGLLDSLLGGQPAQSGISAATKALLLVLAAKAAKDYLVHRQQGAPAQQPVPVSAGPGSILGSLLGEGGQASAALNSLTSSGGLGGLLAGLGGAGALGALAGLFNQNGHGPAMNSWITNGPNQQLQPNQVAEALGPGPVQELEEHTGLPQQTLLEQLARELPAAIDHVTPQGRLPTQSELESTVRGA